MRSSFHLLPVLLLASGFAPALAQTNDLMRVYDLAVQNDANYRAAQFARDAAIEARPQARAALLPQLSGTFSYGYVDTTGTVQQTELDGAGNPVPVERQINNSGTDETLTVTLNQSLFNLESWRRLQQSDRQVALAQAQYRAEEQGLALRTAEAYFGVLSALDSLRSAQAEKTAVERQLEQARRRFEVGLSAITDVQEAQARYDLTVATELQAQQTLSAAREALNEITKTPAGSVATLQDEIPLPAPDPDSVELWVEAAREGNLDLLAAQLNYDIAVRGVQVARSGHLPTLGLQGGYRDSTSESGSFPQDTESSSVTAVLSVPIFAGGLTQANVRQAIATREQRDAQREAAARQVERNTRNAYQAVVTGAARVKALKQAVVSNTTALDASETGLEVGTRTAVDVLNAQQQLYAAERDYFQSRYDYLLAVLRLKAAAGRLGSTDLAEIDRLLIND
jgi:outer membrane protein